MTEDEARAAGLLDPGVAHLLPPGARKATSKGKKGRKKSQSKAAPAGSDLVPEAAEKKRKRSKSRPAVHPKISPGPSGTGTVSLLADGTVDSAEFDFDLVPVPKERARVVTNQKTGQMFGYTPARTKYFNAEIQRVVAHVFAGQRPISGPVRVEMTFTIQVPKSWPKWKRAAALDGLIVPTGRPDMDNLEKALLDAFNEVAIVDDAYVIDRHAWKVYGDLPAIHARIEKTGKLGLSATRKEVEALRRLLDEAAQEAGPVPTRVP